nr:Na+/H+ antiporter NhaA [Nitrosospira sp. Nsp1]
MLPLFALANAGVDFLSAVGAGQQSLMIAIIAGLVIGKPAGIFLASFAAVKIGIARKPDDYSWMQLMAASILAGIGFTMSLFIAGRAFSDPADFAASKIAIFSGSIISAVLGLVMLLLVTSRTTPSSRIAVQDVADKHA